MPDPLIPRAHLFGNPNRSGGTISPDGAHLAWVAPLDGVMNVWVAPLAAPDSARSVTRDAGRGVRDYYWTYDGRHLVFMQDSGGDENWRLHAVDVHTGETRPLTPEGVRASPAGRSRHIRGEVLATLNQRDPKYPDLFRIELATGRITLVAENPGLAGFVTDDRFVPCLASRPTPDGGRDVLRPAAGGGWESWFIIPPEDSFSTGVSHISADGAGLYMRDSRGRDTAALTRMDLATGEVAVLAKHSRADIGGLLTDPDTYAPLAYGVLVERLSYTALGHQLIMPQPDADSGELDEGEVVCGVFLVSGGDGSVVLELVEEALDLVPVAIQEGTECRRVAPVRHRFDVRPGALGGHGSSQRIAVVGAVSEEGLPGMQPVEHVGGAAAVMGLAFCQLDRDRQAVGVHQRVDLGGQTAARTPHALGSRVVPSPGWGGVRTPFLTLPPC